MRSWAEAVQGRFGATGEQLQLVSLYVKVFFPPHPSWIIFPQNAFGLNLFLKQNSNLSSRANSSHVVAHRIMWVCVLSYPAIPERFQLSGKLRLLEWFFGRKNRFALDQVLLFDRRVASPYHHFLGRKGYVIQIDLPKILAANLPDRILDAVEEAGYKDPSPARAGKTRNKTVSRYNVDAKKRTGIHNWRTIFISCPVGTYCEFANFWGKLLNSTESNQIVPRHKRAMVVTKRQFRRCELHKRVCNTNQLAQVLTQNVKTKSAAAVQRILSNIWDV